MTGITTALTDALGDGVDAVTGLLTSNVAVLFVVPVALVAIKYGRRLLAKI